MRKTIPEHTVITCDLCEGTNEFHNFKTETTFGFHFKLLSPNGMPVGVRDINYDLCDDCLHRFGDAIKNVIDGHLNNAIQSLIDSSDSTGCTEDCVVVSADALVKVESLLV